MAFPKVSQSHIRILEEPGSSRERSRDSSLAVSLAESDQMLPGSRKAGLFFFLEGGGGGGQHQSVPLPPIPSRPGE